MGHQTVVGCSVLPPLTEAQIARFWRFVQPDGEHLIWSGPTAYGEPQAHLQRRPVRVRIRAAFVAWDLLDRPPRGKPLLLNTCGRVDCIAPDHRVPADSGDLPHNAPELREARFWECVDMDNGEGCWVWKGGPIPERYGRPTYVTTSINGRILGAHRAAWEYANGRRVPDGLVVCHKCDNPPCCRPSHLFIGTPAENSADMVTKGRAFTPGILDTPARRTRRFTSEQIVAIREHRAKTGDSFAKIGPRFDLTTMGVYHIVRGLTYGDCPGPIEAAQIPFRPRKMSAQVLTSLGRFAQDSRMPDDPLVSIAEAARVAGVSPSTVRRWELEGKLESRRTLGGHRRYLVSEIRALLAASAA